MDTPPQLGVNNIQNPQPLMQMLTSWPINISNAQENFSALENPIDSPFCI